jgi:hypothetical protein
MKTTLFTLLLVSASYAARAELIVIKENGGLFGYKSIQETVDDTGHTLLCQDPGKTRCKAQLLDVVPTGGTYTPRALTEAELEAIDRLVMDAVGERQANGRFVYNEKCLIVFTYNADADRLVYTIYSMEEAIALDLIAS